jgi:hypothetical protein
MNYKRLGEKWRRQAGYPARDDVEDNRPNWPWSDPELCLVVLAGLIVFVIGLFL